LVCLCALRPPERWSRPFSLFLWFAFNCCLL